MCDCSDFSFLHVFKYYVKRIEKNCSLKCNETKIKTKIINIYIYLKKLIENHDE